MSAGHYLPLTLTTAFRVFCQVAFWRSDFGDHFLDWYHGLFAANSVIVELA